MRNVYAYKIVAYCIYYCLKVVWKVKYKYKYKNSQKMIQTVVVTLLCYFVVCFMLLIMVLEYLPGTGKTLICFIKISYIIEWVKHVDVYVQKTNVLYR